MVAYYKITWVMENAETGRKEPFDFATHSARVADMLGEMLSKDERCENVVLTGVKDVDWPF